MNMIPGYRFHPTDVELVKYFLKRKLLGKKFPFDVIAEVEIYKYAPWDLPDISLLKTGDLEWYFFCPRGKKYASGARMNRATEVGYWKTTGKDRLIEHRNEVVGMIKTLIFHTGRAPKGDRTDWVMHEFRLEDKEVADKGIPQDSYVICKVFQKEGLGPKNGAQYGRPFNEEDWDEEAEIGCVVSLPVAALSTPAPLQLNTGHSSAANDMHPSTSEYIGLTSVSCLSELMPSCLTLPSAPPSSNSQAVDDILLMLDSVKEDNTLALNENNKIEEVDNTCEANIADGTPYFDPNEIFAGLGDLDNLDGFGFSCGNKDEYNTNQMLSTDDIFGFGESPGFLELIDLEVPLFSQTKT
ncbi:hypothetical protein TanjilG_31861 [Lupinus angustifolius]|uniref:NAC domain-containing protein n=1 Tax=Lupinus angustifolius TaxID=3871 RepID=A0A394D9L4_LUPAN|nr:PREDICTED: NAC domain-containing protein 82-like isoform X1 [Lupinus angustifolius]OIW19984.1 hypothetical protein TanjilG_31861 [Lupinus angustifolius]